MLETLLGWDRHVFHWINEGWSNGLFDMVMPWARNKLAWLPLYIFSIAWMAYNWPARKVLIVLGFVAVGVFAADTISSKLIKYTVQRPRPCQELVMEPAVVLRVPCGSGYSFTSSHATNHFFLAAFLALLLRPVMGRWRFAWYAWAGLVALAQVYVGVHYPLDVLGGALLGVMIGSSMAVLCLHLVHGTPTDTAASG